MQEYDNRNRDVRYKDGRHISMSKIKEGDFTSIDISDGFSGEVMSVLRSEGSVGFNCMKWGRKCTYNGLGEWRWE